MMVGLNSLELIGFLGKH